MERAVQVKEHDILHSDTTRYQIMNFSGEGCFGKVAKCLNLKTDKMVAVKILKESEAALLRWEVKMLKAIRTLDPDKTNIIRFMESFRFQNLSCLVFEMLDRSLWDLITERKWDPCNLNEIRPVTHQLLVAFDALKDLGIMHTDLKPDNVMLVNHKDKPFKIKLIDFGIALPESKVQPGMTMQPLSYRAPEVTLGLPLSTAVDMWSVGCIMAHMYFGKSLFPGSCEYLWMKVMLHLLGQPDPCQLYSGRNTWKYFTRVHDSRNPEWRFKIPPEYQEVTGIKPEVSNKIISLAKDLDDAVNMRPTNEDPLELEDRMAFLSLLKGCLNVNSSERITPREAMKHCFVTMTHLVDDIETSVYADTAFELMTVSPLTHLDESDNSIDTEIATQDDKSEDSGPDSLEPHIIFSQDENSSDIWSSSGDSEDNDTSSDEKSSDKESGDTTLSLSRPSDEDNMEPESHHSAHKKTSTDMSSNDNLVASDFCDGVRNTTAPSKEESGIAAAATRHTDVLDSDPNGTYIKTGADEANINTGPDGVNINTDPDGADVSTGSDRANFETGPNRTDNHIGLGGANINADPDGDDINTYGVDINTGPDGANINTGPDGDDINADGADINTGSDGANINTGPGGDNINADGANINTGPGGDNINADGADINTGQDGDDINTYGADINTGPDGANIKSVPDGDNINTGPDGDNINTDGADINSGPDGDNINTGPDGARRKTFLRRARKFFGRVRKRVLFIFICGKIEPEN